MRFLFLTPEFPTNTKASGGLSNFLFKFTSLLSEVGHQVDVLTVGADSQPIILKNGVRVYAVPISKNSYLKNLLNRFSSGLDLPLWDSTNRLQKAIGDKANKLIRLHSYDVIQYSDHLGLGRYLKPKREHLTICRCSSAIDLYALADDADHGYDFSKALRVADKTIINADIAIAPSELVAQHISSRLGKKVHVSRPPALLSIDKSQIKPLKWLPKKFILHYAGWLSPKKGTHLALAALKEAITTCPEMVLVLVGGVNMDSLPLSFSWQSLIPNLVIVPPLEPKYLYYLIRSSHAVLLPSIVDNLPNAAIESKLLGKRIITLSGNSVDEFVDPLFDLIVHERTPSALASVMNQAWRSSYCGGSSISEEKASVHGIKQDFSPSHSIGNYLELVRQAMILKRSRAVSFRV